MYVRSSALIRCADTKPGNVVVRLGSPPHRNVRLALIDVAPEFCLEHEIDDSSPGNGNSFGVDDLDAGLGRMDRRYIAAGISLLVHCTEAAYPPNTVYGFGYPRIAECLIKYLRMMFEKLITDEWLSARRTIVQYFGSSDDLSIEDVAYRLERAVGMARLIRLCRDPVDGELYETAALKFKASGFTITNEVKSHADIRSVIEKGEPWKVVACSKIGCVLHPARTAFGMWI